MNYLHVLIACSSVLTNLTHTSFGQDRIYVEVGGRLIQLTEQPDLVYVEEAIDAPLETIISSLATGVAEARGVAGQIPEGMPAIAALERLNLVVAQRENYITAVVPKSADQSAIQFTAEVNDRGGGHFVGASLYKSDEVPGYLAFIGFNEGCFDR